MRSWVPCRRPCSGLGPAALLLLLLLRLLILLLLLLLQRCRCCGGMGFRVHVWQLPGP